MSSGKRTVQTGRNVRLVKVSERRSNLAPWRSAAVADDAVVLQIVVALWILRIDVPGQSREVEVYIVFARNDVACVRVDIYQICAKGVKRKPHDLPHKLIAVGSRINSKVCRLVIDRTKLLRQQLICRAEQSAQPVELRIFKLRKVCICSRDRLCTRDAWRRVDINVAEKRTRRHDHLIVAIQHHTDASVNDIDTVKG